MARTKNVLWMEHEEHGVMPVYDRRVKEWNLKNGWKTAPGPHGSPAHRKLQAKLLAEELGDGLTANALD